MEEMSCPRCSSAMNQRSVGEVAVVSCMSCGGIFLDRADLGNLVEAENDWHQSSGPKTAPLPRITPEMKAPPPSPPRTRSYIETLFGGP